MRKKFKIINIFNLKLLANVILFQLKFFFYNFQRKNLKIFKFFDQKKIGSIPRTVISSFVVILFFYMAPMLVSYGNKNLFTSNEYLNNSKTILAYTLNKKQNGINDENKILDEKDLLFDIFSLNDLEPIQSD